MVWSSTLYVKYEPDFLNRNTALCLISVQDFVGFVIKHCHQTVDSVSFLIGVGITFYSGRHPAKAKWFYPDPILPDAHYKHLESEVTSGFYTVVVSLLQRERTECHKSRSWSKASRGVKANVHSVCCWCSEGFRGVKASVLFWVFFCKTTNHIRGRVGLPCMWQMTAMSSDLSKTGVSTNINNGSFLLGVTVRGSGNVHAGITGHRNGPH